MTFTVNTEPTTTSANRDMMRHVISNLVSNVVRHGDAGCDKNYQLSVENVCKSLTKQQLQHVFNPFYRSSAATKQHADSSGIGLYMVKILLDAKGLDYDFALRKQDVWFVVRFE